jgi:hypothetical protein
MKCLMTKMFLKPAIRDFPMQNLKNKYQQEIDPMMKNRVKTIKFIKLYNFLIKYHYFG